MADEQKLETGKGLEMDGEELFVDFDEIEQYEALPQGTYPTRIVDVALGQIREGKNQGKPKATVTFAVTSDPFVGRKVYRAYSLLPESMWAVGKLAEACELEGIGKVSVNELADIFVGQEVAVSVTHGTYRGQVTSNVAQVYPLSTLEEVDEIADLFG